MRDPNSMASMRRHKSSNAIGLPTRLNVARPTLHQASAEPPASFRAPRPATRPASPHAPPAPDPAPDPAPAPAPACRVPRAACAIHPTYSVSTLHSALCTLQVSSDSLNQQEHAQERRRSLGGRPSLAASKSAASLLDRLGTFVPTSEAA